VGNAAGEAHPVVAEGITMAMQSAWLLAGRLADKRDWIRSPAVRDAVGRDYAAAWRQSFAGRIRAASLIAHWAMNKAAVRASVPLVRKLPSLLTLGARMSGKAGIIIRRQDLENPKSA
jgi:flavin-dependent dehydrogenase